MGQPEILGNSPAQAIERLVPGGIQSLPHGRVCYTQLTNDTGGIIDDLMLINFGDQLFLVANASRHDIDLACLQRGLSGYEIEEPDRALFVLQGPLTSRVIARLAPGAGDLTFMAAAPFVVDGVPLAATRCGYTGEDGFEIAVQAAGAERLAQALLAEQEVRPAGLSARDTLRLVASLCLYGNYIDETTTPIEAGLVWTIGRRRREESGFPGTKQILAQLSDGPRRTLVGLIPKGWAVASAPAKIRNETGTFIGKMTSGGFGATIGGPVAMGDVDTAYAAPDTPIAVIVRDKPIAARIVTLPFVPHNYRTS